MEYPDGRIEIRANGAGGPYVPYDRLPEIDQGAIVENKRLGQVLRVAQLVQAHRDNRRSRSDVPTPGSQGKASAWQSQSGNQGTAAAKRHRPGA